jgi:alpha-tubulin suppressor-like RCC1 family protein
MKRFAAAAVLFLLIALSATPALAACASPAGIAGDLTYNTTYHAYQYCNGTNWMAMGKSPGSGGAGCANPAGVEKDLTYNTTFHVMQYCDGANWIEMGPTGTGGGGGSAATQVISAGGGHTCGIKSDKTLWCWGADGSGQLGDDATLAQKPTPVIVAGGATWKAVAAGGSHTCGIKSDNTLWCWGNDSTGQLGDDATIANQSTPVIVAGGATWKAVAAGNDLTCGIKSDDTLWCWGNDANGGLGDDATIANKSTPVIVAGGATWKAVGAGSNYACGIKSDDTLWCWGNDVNGQLGDDATLASKSTPVIVAGGATWKAVSAGTATCGIKSDDTLWCWGGDVDGALGDDATIAQKPTPVIVAGGATWKATAVQGYGHTCGIRSDDTLWCWGGDSIGQLGDDATLASKPTPVIVAGGATWTAVTTGGSGTTTQHTCGIKSDNTLWCWGADSTGQLGNDGFLINQPTPVPVAISDPVTAPVSITPNAVKSGSSGWGPFISLPTNHTLLLCIATLGTVTGVTWQGASLNLDASDTSTSTHVYIYSLPNNSTGFIGGSVAIATTGTITGTAVGKTFYGTLAAPFDKQSTAAGTSATSPSSGTTATTTQADEFVYGCVATNGPGQSGDDTPGTWSNNFIEGSFYGTTGQGATSNVSASDAYLRATATGTYTAAKTNNTPARAWAAAVATYKVGTFVPCGCTWPTGGCSSPTGAEGNITYNTTSNVMQFCNGSNWIRTGK